MTLNLNLNLNLNLAVTSLFCEGGNYRLLCYHHSPPLLKSAQ